MNNSLPMKHFSRCFVERLFLYDGNKFLDRQRATPYPTPSPIAPHHNCASRARWIAFVNARICVSCASSSFAQDARSSCSRASSTPTRSTYSSKLDLSLATTSRSASRSAVTPASSAMSARKSPLVMDTSSVPDLRTAALADGVCSVNEIVQISIPNNILRHISRFSDHCIMHIPPLVDVPFGSV